MSKYSLSQLKPVMTAAQVANIERLQGDYARLDKEFHQLKTEINAVRRKPMSRGDLTQQNVRMERILDVKELMLETRSNIRAIVIPAIERVESHRAHSSSPIGSILSSLTRPAVATTPRSGSSISSILQSVNHQASEAPKTVEDVVATVARLTGKSVEDVTKEAKVLVDAIKSGAFKGLAGMLLKSKI